MAKVRILIADDTFFMRETLKRYLDPNKYDIVEAVNGAEAVRLYKEHLPHVVSMDITMPEMDGKEALQKIKEIDKGANVMMCTALGQETHVKECIRYGCSNYVVKPFTKEVYVEKIEDMVKRGTINKRCAYGEERICESCQYNQECRVEDKK